MNVRLRIARGMYWFTEQSWTLFVIAGLLMGGAFLSPYFWWTGILGLTLFFIVLTQVRGRKHAFWYGTLSGTIKTLLVGGWVWYVYPLTWMGDFSAVSQLFGIGWMWLTGSLAVGVSLGIFASIIHPYLEHPFRYGFIPLLYVMSEILGSIFFSLMQYGPGGTVNTHTSFGYLGYTFAHHGIIEYLAMIAGVYGLSLFVGTLAFFFARRVVCFMKTGEQITWKYYTVPVVLFVTFFISLPFGSTEATMRIATINTQFENDYDMSPIERADRVRMLVDAFRAALASDSDIILFPETAYALGVFGSTENIFDFIDTQTEREVLVVDSDKLMHTDGTSAVRAVIYDTKTETAHPMFKKFLVPSGEFLPYQLSFMMSLLGFKKTGETLDTFLEFVPADEDMYREGTPLPGVLFCSESVSPTEALFVSQEATLPLILHPVSHAWLNNPKIFWYQLDLITRTQVRFAGVPLVQAANMWESKAYNRYGHSIAGQTLFETASTSVIAYDI